MSSATAIKTANSQKEETSVSLKPINVGAMMYFYEITLPVRIVEIAEEETS